MKLFKSIMLLLLAVLLVFAVSCNGEVGTGDNQGSNQNQNGNQNGNSGSDSNSNTNTNPSTPNTDSIVGSWVLLDWDSNKEQGYVVLNTLRVFEDGTYSISPIIEVTDSNSFVAFLIDEGILSESEANALPKEKSSLSEAIRKKVVDLSLQGRFYETGTYVKLGDYYVLTSNGINTSYSLNNGVLTSQMDSAGIIHVYSKVSDKTGSDYAAKNGRVKDGYFEGEIKSSAEYEKDYGFSYVMSITISNDARLNYDDFREITDYSKLRDYFLDGHGRDWNKFSDEKGNRLYNNKEEYIAAVRNMTDEEFIQFAYEEWVRDYYESEENYYVIEVSGSFLTMKYPEDDNPSFVASIIDDDTFVIAADADSPWVVHRLTSATYERGFDITWNGVLSVKDVSILPEHVVVPAYVKGVAVTALANNAFKNCTTMKTVELPNSLERIGNYAFNGCENLTAISIPESVTEIGYLAFQSCRNLTSIRLPASLTSIGTRVFNNCTNLTRIEVASENQTYASADGVLYSKDFGTLVIFPAGITGSFTIPSTVSIIDEYSFRSSRLTSVIIPETVTSIYYGAFQNSQITSLSIPASAQIDSAIIAGCPNLKTIEVASDNTYLKAEDLCLYSKSGTILFGVSASKTGAYSISDKTKTILDLAFYKCSGLTSVTIPNTVKFICKNAFYGCDGLTSIIIPESVEEIGFYAFAYCTGLTEFTIPSSVTNLGYRIFIGCTNLSVINYSGTRDAWAQINKDTDWYGGAIVTVVHCSDGDVSI